MKKAITPAVTTDSTPAEKITPANVTRMGERIAIRALKTCYQKGGQPFIYSLYCDLIADIAERKNSTDNPLSDGYDVAQTACLALLPYMGKDVTAPIGDGVTDKKGAPVTILRNTFRAVNRYIMGERQHEYSRVYLDEITDSGDIRYIVVNPEWDLPTIEDYRKVMDYIERMRLSNMEKRVLSYRMRGKSYGDIARIIGTTKATIAGYQTRIKAKARTIPEIVTALEKFHV